MMYKIKQHWMNFMLPYLKMNAIYALKNGHKKMGFTKNVL